jgi:translation initiation factor IF-3
MFPSCVRRYKGFLNGFFLVVRGRSAHDFNGFEHVPSVGDCNGMLWGLNSTTSRFSCLYSTNARTTPKASDSSVLKPTAASSRKHKSDSGPIITLIGTDNNPSVMSLSDAEKIAKRRDLKLIRIVDLDTKTQRPIYQLMTTAQFYTEDRKLRKKKSAKEESGFKGNKLVTLSHRITPHDLSSKLKNITKWLSKAYEVRVVINGDNDNMKCAVSASASCILYLYLYLYFVFPSVWFWRELE